MPSPSARTPRAIRHQQRRGRRGTELVDRGNLQEGLLRGRGTCTTPRRAWDRRRDFGRRNGGWQDAFLSESPARSRSRKGCNKSAGPWPPARKDTSRWRCPPARGPRRTSEKGPPLRTPHPRSGASRPPRSASAPLPPSGPRSRPLRTPDDPPTNGASASDRAPMARRWRNNHVSAFHSCVTKRASSFKEIPVTRSSERWRAKVGKRAGRSTPRPLAA